MPGANFHTVYMNLETLLVECKQCNRRAALGKGDGLPIWQGNMMPVRDARLKCRCGCAEVRRYIPGSQDEIDFFLAGDPAGKLRQVM